MTTNKSPIVDIVLRLPKNLLDEITDCSHHKPWSRNSELLRLIGLGRDSDLKAVATKENIAS